MSPTGAIQLPPLAGGFLLRSRQQVESDIFPDIFSWQRCVFPRRIDDVRDMSGSPPIAAELLHCGERRDVPCVTSAVMSRDGAQLYER